MNYANFYGSSMTSYIPVTLWKLVDKTRCGVCVTYAMFKDDIEAWVKWALLACSRNAGAWYKLLQIIENLS